MRKTMDENKNNEKEEKNEQNKSYKCECQVICKKKER